MKHLESAIVLACLVLTAGLSGRRGLLGAVALAAGALIGTMLPGTEVEDAYLGETRDSLVDSAREIAEDKVQELSQAIRDVAQPNATAPGTSVTAPS